MDEYPRYETMTVSFALAVNSKKPSSFVIVPVTEFKFDMCEALKGFLFQNQLFDL